MIAIARIFRSLIDLVLRTDQWSAEGQTRRRSGIPDYDTVDDTAGYLIARRGDRDLAVRLLVMSA